MKTQPARQPHDSPCGTHRDEYTWVCRFVVLVLRKRFLRRSLGALQGLWGAIKGQGFVRWKLLAALSSPLLGKTTCTM